MLAYIASVTLALIVSTLHVCVRCVIVANFALGHQRSATGTTTTVIFNSLACV